MRRMTKRVFRIHPENTFSTNILNINTVDYPAWFFVTTEQQDLKKVVY
jgi:hypothetical protein